MLRVLNPHTKFRLNKKNHNLFHCFFKATFNIPWFWIDFKSLSFSGVHDDKFKKFECETCAQRFCYKSRLNYHISTKHSKAHKTFDCSLCDKQFSVPNSLKDHKKRIHCNEKTFLCKSCPKQFYKKYDLTVILWLLFYIIYDDLILFKG